MVPHLAARKAHQRLWEFSFATPKRLLQQYLPQADIEPSRAEAKKLQPTSMSTVRFEPIVADLTSTLGLAECVLKNDFVTSEGKKVASSRRDRLSARISRHKVPLE